MEQEKKKALLNGAKKVTLNYVLPIALAVAAGGLTGWLVSRNANAVSTDKFTVTWKNYDGTILEVDNDVEKGATPTYDGTTPTKPGTVKVSYSFNGWSPSVVPVTGNTTYTAQFAEATNKYTVTWKNYDGTTLETDSNVDYGSTPTYDGETPVKPASTEYTYTFNGWSPVISPVTMDTTYTAQFTAVSKFTVTWKNYDGTILEEDKNVDYGVTPTYDGKTPVKPGSTQAYYTFTGWSPAVTAVTGDATYTAQFSEYVNKYTITWKNYDGTTLEVDENVEYGVTPTYDGATPTKPSTEEFTYEFNGWSPVISPVTMNTTYTAQFAATPELPKYVITFKNDDGVTLETKKVQLGEIPTYTGETPTKPEETKEQYYDYTFTGWDKEITGAVQDTTYTAIYNAVHQTYKAIYYNDDGSILEEKTVNKGEESIYTGPTPTKATEGGYQYRFKEFKKTGSQETGEVNFTATYDQAMEGLTISEDGTVISYIGSEENVVVPSHFGTSDVTKIAASAFNTAENKNIKTIVIPDTVKEIGDSAFAGLENLESITFPNNPEFTTIETFLFWGCKKLKTITIPDSITKIGATVFKECDSLKSITLGKGVLDIDSNIFNDCPSLEEITISTENPKYINSEDKHLILQKTDTDELILKQCLPSVETVSIPDNVVEIGEGAFNRCTKITSIDLNNVTKIGANAFNGCSMKDFNTGNVTELAAGIFNNCEYLTKVTLGPGLQNIDPQTFTGCNKLETIEVETENQYFSSDENGILYDFNKTKIIRCPEAKASVTIPTESSFPNLKVISANAFQNCSLLTSIYIPNNIEEICEYAFKDCTGLSTLTLGSNVTHIGGYVVSGTKLKEVTLGAAIKYENIDLTALQGCSTIEKMLVDENNPYLESRDGILYSKATESEGIILRRCPNAFKFNDNGEFAIPNDVVGIGDYAFRNVTNLKYLSLHENITSIGAYAFSAPNLTTLHLKEGRLFGKEGNKISENAFKQCNIATVEFDTIIKEITKKVMEFLTVYSGIEIGKLTFVQKSNDTEIVDGMLSNCAYFNNVILKDGVTKIGNYAFNKCPNLETITLPTTVTEIGQYAFCEDAALKQLPDMRNVTKIGDDAFYSCTALTKADLSECSVLTSLGIDTFRRCYNLTSVSLPSSLETIGGFAFADCAKIETLSFGTNSNVTTIGKYAFANCSSLKSITLPKSLKDITEGGKTTKALGDYIFQGANKDLIMIYYEGTGDEFDKIYEKGVSVAFTGSSITRVKCLGDNTVRDT